MTYDTLSRKTVYDGPIFSIDRVELSLPDQQSKKYDLVLIQNAVTILPIDDDGNVLFVRQYRVGSSSFMLELPAGKMEAGESAQVTAEREIREETGMGAKKMQPLGQFFMSPGYSTEYMYTFLASGLYSAPLTPDADEFLNVIKIPLAEVLTKIQEGTIVDGKTLAVFMQALPLLKLGL
jgi:NTP pyrophosphohydrolases including oxidative damage repair enzymes